LSPFDISGDQFAHAWSLFDSQLPPIATAEAPLKAWFRQVLHNFAPRADQLAQLSSTAAFLFGFDVEAARARPENAALLTELANRVRVHVGPVTAEVFNTWIEEIRKVTGAHGNALLAPVTIAITGSRTVPGISNLVQLIEDGASLSLPIPNVRERIERFVGV
jgi:glutamyl/glutaminyl-tRNA synthetase